MNSHWFSKALPLAATVFFSVQITFAGDVSFNHDVRPILSDRCFACHGPDANERKAKLRLDQPDGKDGAYRELDGSAAIVPGSLEKSELWYRITTDDPDDLMPPAKAHRTQEFLGGR